ncbi:MULTISPECIES: hypothetical protein [Brucella/Ochrobactrum group]|uniref:hypothetical protein n=1 Tax=Brucella/Ochrobactrum group TaxID=2826938 RepID=UPI001E303860|nr:MULTISPECIES: hypothetical protein [Brucella/Ochrobactrum group]MCQ9144573.1 hypothetical protein [Ochrobactrum sp. BTU2]UGQ21437.1 hypothetical protein LRL11_01475 [Brucella anthropi]
MTDQSNSRVTEAARWLATTPERDRPHPIIPALRRQFGLTVVEATLAAAESVLIQARAN